MKLKCSAYIATSVDGFIATPDGSVDWLYSAGVPDADMGEDADMGFAHYMQTVDCMIMGRKCMQVIDAMQLSDEQWPYGDCRIIVLSHSLKQPPKGLKDKVELYSGDIGQLIERLITDNHQHIYVDGGTTIQGFLNLELITEMTITRAPILLGEGIPLFGKTKKMIHLEKCSAVAFANDFIQEHYKINYID